MVMALIVEYKQYWTKEEQTNICNKAQLIIDIKNFMIKMSENLEN